MIISADNMMGSSSGYTFIDDFTSVECVSANNRPMYTSAPINFTGIPKTENVIYAVISQTANAGTFTVGNKYNLISWDKRAYASAVQTIIIDGSNIVADFSGLSLSLSGNTLTSPGSSEYTNYGLFVIAEK